MKDVKMVASLGKKLAVLMAVYLVEKLEYRMAVWMVL